MAPVSPGAAVRRRAPSILAAVVAVVLTACSGTPAGTPPITPGTSAAPREVIIIARDNQFSPPVLDLVPGETVVLHVLNGGLETHEAIIGDEAVQTAWEAAEADANDPPPPPGPTPAVSVAPELAGLRVVVRSGERQDVVWTVPSTPGLIVGCHIPGHYARGMRLLVRFVGPGASVAPS